VRRLGAVAADVGELAAAVAARLQHRVHDEVHGQLRAGEGHAEGVDQERHVVRDREHERVAALETVALRLGIEHPHQATARGAAGAEGEVRERRPRELLRSALGQVLFGDAVEVGAQEALLQLVAAAGSGCGARNALDERDARRGNAAEQLLLFNSH
jgi:hypothetical protein